jgi:flagellar hook-associated protein 2
MAGSQALGGVLTGIDYEALIQSSLVRYARRANLLKSEVSVYNSKTKATEAIEAQLKSLKSLVDGLRNASDLRRAKATSSDKDALSVTVADGASEGTFQIEIGRLASAEREVHAGISATERWTFNNSVSDAGDLLLSADDISDVAGGNYLFTFQFGDEAQVTVDLSAYDATGISLTDLVNEINTAAGYSAASVATVNGLQQLRLTALGAGAGKALTVSAENAISGMSDIAEFKRTTDGADGRKALVGAGNFVYTYKGATRTIVTNETTTLEQLANLINNDSGNAGVTASIMHYEVDVDHAWHLMLAGGDTGSDSGIEIEEATTLAAFAPDAANWTQTQTAQNAQIRVDGYPVTGWIEQKSNTISDLIPNVTLDLQKVTKAEDGPITVTLQRDTQSLKGSLSSLVSAYNSLVDTIAQHTGYDAKTKTKGIFQGDSLMSSIRNLVRTSLVGTVNGFSAGNDALSRVSDLGLEIDKEGHLKLDSDTIDKALKENYSAVLALIGAVGSGVSGNKFIQFNSAYKTTQPGSYEVEIDFDAATGSIAAARMRLAGEAEWRAATVDGKIIRGKSGNPEEYMELQAIWDSSRGEDVPGSGLYTERGTVRVQQGFAGALYDKLEGLLDKTDGLISTKTGQYGKAVTSLERQIDLQQDRLDRQEERLRAKYARLETLMSQMQSQQGAFEAMINSMIKTS